MCMVTEITKEDIEEHGVLISTDDLIVVMFYGTKCGPCEATMPHYEAVSGKFAEKTSKIKFYRIHAWDPTNNEYCRQTWGINGVPHFKVLFNNSVMVDKQGGGDYATMFKMVHDGIDETFKQFVVRI